MTHALLPSSLAIDAGDPIFNMPSSFDQRGMAFVRVSGGRIDIGAFEVQALAAVDFDADNDVDGNDFLVWQRNFSSSLLAAASSGESIDGDADLNLELDGEDLSIWEQQFGTVLVPAVSRSATISLPPIAEEIAIPPLDLIDAAMAIDLLEPKFGQPDFKQEAVVSEESQSELFAELTARSLVPALDHLFDALSDEERVFDEELGFEIDDGETSEDETLAARLLEMFAEDLL